MQIVEYYANRMVKTENIKWNGAVKEDLPPIGIKCTNISKTVIESCINILIGKLVRE